MLEHLDTEEPEPLGVRSEFYAAASSENSIHQRKKELGSLAATIVTGIKVLTSPPGGSKYDPYLHQRQVTLPHPYIANSYVILREFGFFGRKNSNADKWYQANPKQLGAAEIEIHHPQVIDDEGNVDYPEEVYAIDYDNAGGYILIKREYGISGADHGSAFEPEIEVGQPAVEARVLDEPQAIALLGLVHVLGSGRAK